MKTYLTYIIVALISFKAKGQICVCPDRNLNIECDTAFLKSNSLIYYQFDCDSIWLTLENHNSDKYEIFKIETKSAYLPNMLHLKQDSDQSALFSVRHSKDSLDFFLIDKSNGQIIRTFRNVINSDRNKSCFVAYYKEDSTNIIVYNISTGIEIEIETPIEILNKEMVYTGSKLKGESLLLYFYKNRREQKEVEIDIKNTLAKNK